jgi:hypothetical protein
MSDITGSLWPSVIWWYGYIHICIKSKNHSYKHNEQINSQNIDNSECFGVKFAQIYPEMTSQ